MNKIYKHDVGLLQRTAIFIKQLQNLGYEVEFNYVEHMQYSNVVVRGKRLIIHQTISINSACPFDRIYTRATMINRYTKEAFSFMDRYDLKDVDNFVLMIKKYGVL